MTAIEAAGRYHRPRGDALLLAHCESLLRLTAPAVPARERLDALAGAEFASLLCRALTGDRRRASGPLA